MRRENERKRGGSDGTLAFSFSFADDTFSICVLPVRMQQCLFLDILISSNKATYLEKTVVVEYGKPCSSSFADDSF
jgi:hypothetical protein